MKKYLLFLIAILSVSLTSCSVDDDCGNGFYRVDQLGKANNGFYPEDLIPLGLVGDAPRLITSEQEFLRTVKGSEHFIGKINFNRENLLIGETKIQGYRGIISTSALFKESCNYNRDNEVIITLDVNKGSIHDFVTYHAILPKTSNNKMFTRVDINYR